MMTVCTGYTVTVTRIPGAVFCISGHDDQDGRNIGGAGLALACQSDNPDSHWTFCLEPGWNPWSNDQTSGKIKVTATGSTGKDDDFGLDSLTVPLSKQPKRDSSNLPWTDNHYNEDDNKQGECGAAPFI